jgi:hypothetical protein
MSIGEPMIVAGPDDLAAISHIRAPGRVALRLRELNAVETARWEEQLSSTINACGCGEATVFLFGAVGTLSTLVYFHSWLVPKETVPLTIVCVSIALGSIGLGKTFGRFRAKLQLERLVSQLQAFVRHNPVPWIDDARSVEKAIHR